MACDTKDSTTFEFVLWRRQPSSTRDVFNGRFHIDKPHAKTAANGFKRFGLHTGAARYSFVLQGVNGSLRRCPQRDVDAGNERELSAVAAFCLL